MKKSIFIFFSLFILFSQSVYAQVTRNGTIYWDHAGVTVETTRGYQFQVYINEILMPGTPICSSSGIELVTCALSFNNFVLPPTYALRVVTTITETGGQSEATSIVIDTTNGQPMRSQINVTVFIP